MEPTTGKAKYYTLMEALKEQILSGTIKPGQKLPSENELTRHLLETGRRNIIGIFKADDSQGAQRHKGYVQALQESGIPYDPENVIWFHTEDRKTKPSLMLSMLLDSKKSVDAAVCYNDQIALAVISMLEEKGISVPEDIAVTGYDNSLIGQSSPIGITTIAHPQEKLGEMAAELILEKIRKVPEEESSVKRLISPELIVRGSTAGKNLSTETKKIEKNPREEKTMGMDAKTAILEQKTALGIEFGSTRIKAVLIGADNAPIASGDHEWENRYDNGVWTYTLEDIWTGLQDAYTKMAADVREKYDITLTRVGAIGFSAMMHGYMAFDKAGNLLVPFRTWRNNITEEASEKLTDLFGFHIPQRWTIAHLYQAILNGEPHVADIDYVTTLAGYIQWKMTGERVVGVGEASGIFPIDSETNTYFADMIAKFDEAVADKAYSWKALDVLPHVLTAGDNAGVLTKEGAALLDMSGNLEAGIPLCPPEGDAGTGMAATNSVRIRTGNVSAGTSVFAMIVLEKNLSKVYPEIDMVTTPSGHPVAMVHCQNCTSDLNAWVNLFREFAQTFGMEISTNDLFGKLYNKALEGDADCGGLLAYNYFSGEHVTGFNEGRPVFARTPDAKFNLANFMRVNLFTSLGALKVGLDILMKEEHVQVDQILGHGGLFKTKGVGQKILAGAIDAPVSVMETAGEGGAWGIALLASYMINKEENETLEDYLDAKVFAGNAGTKMDPDPADVAGFEVFTERYKKGLPIERAAVESLK